MAVATVTVWAPPDNGSLPNTIPRPAVTVAWTGGTGPYDVDIIWDDDPLFGNANGRQQTASSLGVVGTGPVSVVPGADLALLTAGTTWYISATVTDTADLGAASDTNNDFTYIDPQQQNRHYYLLANVGVGFGGTDDPAGGWGEAIGGNADGGDGLARSFNRHYYLLHNTGVGFKDIDQPADGWGEALGGNADGGDGWERDFNRYLYQLANVDSTQPCPFIFSLSTTTIRQGESLTVYGQGLVSATDPSVDAYGAEVRLYDTPDLGGSYTVLPITTWTAGETQDSIVATIPGGSSSGFVAVVHTVGATCAGSNFRGLTVIIAEPDREAGWWLEAWDLRNSTRQVVPIAGVYEAGFEDVANDMGRGYALLPADHPDLATILDRAASPPVQLLIKVYLHDRYAFAFIPTDAARTYTDDGASAVRLYGPGKDHILEWGVIHNYDWPAAPSQQSEWVYGSTDDVFTGGDMEPENQLQNPGFEDLDELPWSTVPTGGIFASEFYARTGVAGVKITPTALGGGIQQEFGVTDGQRIYLDAWVRDPTGTGPRTMRLQAVKSDDTTVAVSTDLVLTATWQRMTVTTIADETGTWTFQLIQTAGPLVNVGADEGLAMDDAAAYTSLPVQLNGVYRATALLSRTNAADGEHSMELQIDAGSDATYNGIDGVIAVQPNQAYTLRATIKGTAGDRVFFQSRLNNFLARDEKDLTGGFDLFTISGTTGDDETTIRWGIAGREAAAITIYIDSLSATPGQPAAAGGQLVLDALGAIQARGVLPFVQAGFTAGLDSAGVPWTESLSMDLRPEWTLFDLCQKLVGLGYDYSLQPNNWLAGGDTGWTLYLWNPGGAGTNFTSVTDGPAILPSPTVEVAQPSQAAPLATRVLGSGGEGIWTQVDASAAIQAALEVREQWLVNREAVEATTLFRAITHRLNTVVNQGRTATVTLTEAGEPLAYLDFRPFDTLRVHLPAAAGQNNWVADDAYRVAAITARLLEDGRQQYTLDLGAYQLHAERLRDLLVARMQAKLGTDNYRPGTGTSASGVRVT